MTYQVDVLNPKAIKLLLDLADLDLISITQNSEDDFLKVVNRLRKKAASNPPSFDEITKEMLTIFHNEGPYIVWGFQASPDVYTSRIAGQENSSVRGLNGFHLETFFIKPL